ncbi:Protein Hook 2 [Allomyces javanicus]|nr:Protein Hook 2 [Allomyces javanicus]
MDNDARHRALVLWVNTFATITEPCASFDGLATGVHLSQAAVEIDPNWFALTDQFHADPATWIDQYNNLRTLHRKTVRFAQTALGLTLHPEFHLDIDYEQIVRVAHLDDLEKLVTLLLALALYAPAKATLVPRIMALPTDVQETAMFIIHAQHAAIPEIRNGQVPPESVPPPPPASLSASPELASSAVGSAPSSPPAATNTAVPTTGGALPPVTNPPIARTPGPRTPLSAARRQSRLFSASSTSLPNGTAVVPPRAASRSPSTIALTSPTASPAPAPAVSGEATVPAAQLETERRDWEARVRAQVAEYDQLAEKHRALQAEHADLAATVRAMEAMRAESPADILLKSEVSRLKAQLAVVDEQKHAADMAYAQQCDVTADLVRQVEELEAEAMDARRLRDEVEELQYAAEKLAKAEAKLELFKKKLDESAELRRQMKVLEEQNRAYQQQAQRLEDEYLKLSETQPHLDGVRASAQRVELENDELRARNVQLAEELADAHHQIALLEDRVANEQERSRDMEERLRELELSQSTGGDTVPMASVGAAHHEELEGKVAELEAAVRHAESESAKLTQEKTALIATLDQHKALLDKARDMIKQLGAKKEEPAPAPAPTPAPVPVPGHAMPPLPAPIPPPSAAAAARAAEQEATERALRDELETAYRRLRTLEHDAAKVRDAWRTEQALVASAWYQLPHIDPAAKLGTGGASWLAQQRKLLTQQIRGRF